MSWVPPLVDSRYGDWSFESASQHRYLGTIEEEEGMPAFYDTEEHEVYRGELDEESRRVTPEDESSWDLDPEETLGEFLESVGTETGWESLSAFAREHLEDEESA